MIEDTVFTDTFFVSWLLHFPIRTASVSHFTSFYGIILANP